MSNFVVEVKKVEAIDPIDGADAIEVATIGLYKSVVSKGLYKAGDYAIYIPEASVVPDWIIEKLNLAGRLAGSAKNRVKAVKLRGQLSQGLLFPLVLAGKDYEIQVEGKRVVVEPGQDVTEILGITKYEPPIPACLAGEVYSVNSSVLYNYDLENIKKYPNVIQEGEEVDVREKLHGTQLVLVALPADDAEIKFENHIDGMFLVASKGQADKGLSFKDNEKNQTNIYVRAVKEHPTLLPHLRILRQEMMNSAAGMFAPLVIYMELFGSESKQDLLYGVTKGAQLRIYAARAGFRSQYQQFSADAVQSLATSLGVEMPPLVYRGPFKAELVQEWTDGKELISGESQHIREGVVITPAKPRRDPNIGQVQLKSVSEAYLLRKNGTEHN